MTATRTRAATAAPPAGLAAFMAAIRAQESGGNYREPNGQGAYQIIQSNWPTWATEAGYPQYASDPNASDAPAQVQDAVAAQHILGYFYGPAKRSWYNVAKAWNGGPGCIGRPCANSVLGPGNTGVDNYAAEVMRRMSAQPGGGAQNPTLTGANGTTATTAAYTTSVPGQTNCYFEWGGISMGVFSTGHICFDGIVFSGVVVLGALTMLAGTALVLAAVGSKAPVVGQTVQTLRKVTPARMIPE